jgi:hypothetical protein
LKQEKVKGIEFGFDQTYPSELAQQQFVENYTAERNACFVSNPKLKITTDYNTDNLLLALNEKMFANPGAKAGTEFNVTYAGKCESIRLLARVHYHDDIPTNWLMYWPSANSLISLFSPPALSASWLTDNEDMSDWAEGPFCSYPKYKSICGRVHSGIHRLYKHMELPVFRNFERALKRFSVIDTKLTFGSKIQYSNRTLSGIYFSGMGIGGALASLAALDTQSTYSTATSRAQPFTLGDVQIHVASFNAPRFGSTTFARYVHNVACTKKFPQMPWFTKQSYLTFKRYFVTTLNRPDLMTVILPFPFTHVGREFTLMCQSCNEVNPYELHSTKVMREILTSMSQGLKVEDCESGTRVIRGAVSNNFALPPKAMDPPRLIWKRVLKGLVPPGDEQMTYDEAVALVHQRAGADVFKSDGKMITSSNLEDDVVKSKMNEVMISPRDIQNVHTPYRSVLGVTKLQRAEMRRASKLLKNQPLPGTSAPAPPLVPRPTEAPVVSKQELIAAQNAQAVQEKQAAAQKLAEQKALDAKVAAMPDNASLGPIPTAAPVIATSADDTPPIVRIKQLQHESDQILNRSAPSTTAATSAPVAPVAPVASGSATATTSAPASSAPASSAPVTSGSATATTSAPAPATVAKI